MQGPLARLDFDLPALGSADVLVPRSLAFQQKGGAVADLGDGREDAPVPYRRSNEVLSGSQQRGKVKALVAPMGQVAAGGAVAGAMAVYKEDEAVIGADADRVTGWNRCQGKRAPEMKHQGLAQGSCGMRDP
jgi:hypothetical protein